MDEGADRRGAVLEADFDANGNPQQVIDPDTGVSTFTYDGADRVETVTSADRGTLTFGYDGSERIPSTITDEYNKVTYQDVVDGLVRSVTDADGVTTELRFWPSRQLKEVENGYANITKFEYDGAGRLTATELPSGDRTVTEYDDAGRVTKVTAADLGETVTTYDDAGRIETITDPEGGVTAYDYDDVTGLLDSMTDPMLRVTDYSYDTAGRLKRTTFEDSSYTEVDYGVLGRVSKSRDELLRETVYHLRHRWPSRHGYGS
ncbi:MAG: hypothetical protein M5U19_00250 [Microthrixaceae bacterium]|nr:hypothetical protein [Microthrixaceae bacterium]